MKGLKILVATIIMASFSTVGFSQKIAYYHKALTNQHAKVKMHADAIVIVVLNTKSENLNHANEATKSLEEAKKTLNLLINTMSEKHKEVAKQHYATIKMYHMEATIQAAMLMAELKKKTLNQTKIKEHAKKLSEAIDKAENEH